MNTTITGGGKGASPLGGGQGELLQRDALGRQGLPGGSPRSRGVASALLLVGSDLPAQALAPVVHMARSFSAEGHSRAAAAAIAADRLMIRSSSHTSLRATS